MEDDKTILETYMCGYNNELDVKERISDLSPLLLKAYDLGALHAIVGDDVRSVDYLSDEKILDMIKSSDTNIRYNKARLYSSKIVKAVLDECELNGTYDKELKKMEDEIEIKEMISNVHEALEGRYELSGYDLHTIHYFLCEFDVLLNSNNKPLVIANVSVTVCQSPQHQAMLIGLVDRCQDCGVVE